MAGVTIQKRGQVYQYKFEVASEGGKRKFINKSGFKSKDEAEKEWIIAYNLYLDKGISNIEYKDISYSDYLDYWMDHYSKDELEMLYDN